MAFAAPPLPGPGLRRSSPPVKPVLENGQRLSRAEFERRYMAMPRVKKAELIEGVVFMGSPVRVYQHAAPHSILVGLSQFYAGFTRGVQSLDNATLRLDADNEPQPDVMLRVIPAAGGRCLDTEDGYVEGAPELCMEVASSSASIDVGKKKHAYQRSGVQEYLVWLVEEERIEWWQLVEGVYQPLAAEAGIVRSLVLPGLWLDLEALLLGDFARALTVLQQGLNSEEHQAFAGRLVLASEG